MAWLVFEYQWLQRLSYPLCVISVIVLLFGASQLVYNLFFHPIRAFPGPMLWGACRIPFAWSLATGNLVHDTHSIHKKYGSVVRIAPNELSFIEPDAWRDIYGHRPGHYEFTKNPIWTQKAPNGVFSVIDAPEEYHRRARKVINHAFTPNSLRKQEYLIHKTVDLFISKLRTLKEIELSAWSGYCTFDITGDLMFGQTFGCISQGRYHDWVAYLFSNLKAASLMASIKFYPLFVSILFLVLPRKVFEERDRHFNSSTSWLRSRIENGEKRHDFVKYILENNAGEEKITMPELEASASLLVLAGSMTTSVHFDSTISLLLKHPLKLTKLLKEIRREFQSEGEITGESTAKLPYLQAVLQESLRIAPPIPGQVPRMVPKYGDSVCGIQLPENTFVSVAQYPMYHSDRNFTYPDVFIPERWLKSSSSLYRCDTGDPPFDDLTFVNDRYDAFRPFSIGPRNCIGMLLAKTEINIIISKLLWNFELEMGQGFDRDWIEQKTYALWDRTCRWVKWSYIRDG